MLNVELIDADATVEWGRRFGEIAKSGGVVYLQGGLGAGKTTLTRGILRAFGHQGAVKSPTYTLVEPYHFADISVYHFDLYRLIDPEELELIGVRDYFEAKALVIVEWPSHGEPLLPEPDITLHLQSSNAGSQRLLKVQAHTQRGQHWLTQMTQ